MTRIRLTSRISRTAYKVGRETDDDSTDYLLLLWISLSITALLASCIPNRPRIDAQAAAEGRQLYHVLACDSCHALDAVGSTRTYAPTHNHLCATAEQRIHAADYTGKAQTAEEYIAESIVEPRVYAVAGYEHLRFGMPTYAHLSDRDVHELVQFLCYQE